MAEKLTAENEQLRKENEALKKQVKDLQMGGGLESSWSAFKSLMPGARKKIMEKNRVREGKKEVAELMKAAKDGDLDQVEKLLESGVPVDICESEFQETALMVAAKVGNTKIVELLLANRAAIDQRDIYGETALYKSCEWGREETALALIQRGARLDVPTKRNKFTPLMICAKNGHSELASILVKEGASLKAMNNLGQTALDCAKQAERHETVAAIEEAAAHRRKSKRVDPTTL